MTTAIQERSTRQSVETIPSTGEYLSFRLGAEEYGIEILKVQEIRGYEAPTRMVNAPVEVLGVLNLRGVIVPVLDLRIRFGMTEVKYDSLTVTIVLNIGARVLGMVVDSVSDVIALGAGQIKPAPEFSGAIDTHHVTGLATIEQGETQRMLILLDIDKFMRSSEVGLISSSEQ